MIMNRIVLTGLLFSVISITAETTLNFSKEELLAKAQAKHHHKDAQCTFCKIVDRKSPAKIIAENEDVIIFESIRPVHPTHCLIVPKSHLVDIKSAQNSDSELIGKLFMAASNLGKHLDGAQAFNLQVNNGAQAGQTVFHLHVHFTSPNRLKTVNPKI